MPHRPYTVIGEVGKGAASCRGGEGQCQIGGVLHLPDSAFCRGMPRNLFIAVAAMVKLRDHEAGHVGDGGLNHTGGESRRLSLVIGEGLEAAVDIPISTG